MYTHLTQPEISLFAVDLQSAIDLFFQTLSHVQAQQLSDQHIQLWFDDLGQELNERWQVLKSLATDGMVEHAKMQLSDLLGLYAQRKAIYQFLTPRADAWKLSKATPGLETAITQNVHSKQTQLASELCQLLYQAMLEREEKKRQQIEQLNKTHLHHAEQVIEREWQRNQTLFSVAQQALQHVQSNASVASTQLREAHDDARASLQVAIHAAQPAIQLAQSAPAMQALYRQSLEEALPSAISRAHRKGCLTRVILLLIAVATVISLPFIAYLLVQLL